MSNIFKASKTNSSVPVKTNVSRSNLFKITPVIKSTFKIINSEFPELNDRNKEKELIILHDGYMSAFQKELIVDVKSLEPGCIMYTQGNNNEIIIDYGDMKDRLYNENNENNEDNEYKNNEYDDDEVNFKLIANNAFNNIINKWEKYRNDYIKLYDEYTYNKLYRMKPSFNEDINEYEDESIDDNYNEDSDNYYE